MEEATVVIENRTVARKSWCLFMAFLMVTEGLGRAVFERALGGKRFERSELPERRRG